MTQNQWMREAMLTLISAVAITLPNKQADTVGDTLLRLYKKSEELTEKEKQQ